MVSTLQLGVQPKSTIHKHVECNEVCVMQAVGHTQSGALQYLSLPSIRTVLMHLQHVSVQFCAQCRGTTDLNSIRVTHIAVTCAMLLSVHDRLSGSQAPASYSSCNSTNSSRDDALPDMLSTLVWWWLSQLQHSSIVSPVTAAATVVATAAV
jgi:hypothetical protein